MCVTRFRSRCFAHGQKTKLIFVWYMVRHIVLQVYIYIAWVKLVGDIGLGTSHLDSKNV